MKSIAIHQPNYIPWLGYFYKVYLSDVFVFLDDAQFSNKGMHNYHYIKTPQGAFRLKIPVLGAFGSSINEVTTNDALGWRERHLKIIESNYKRARFFDPVFKDYKLFLENSCSNLAMFNEQIIRFICGKLGFKTEFVRSSSLDVISMQEKRIIEICTKLHGKIYYSGTGARAYQNEKNFAKHGIILKYIEYEPFEYPQLWNGFQKNVTIIDVLMNCGYDWDSVVTNQKN